MLPPLGGFSNIAKNGKLLSKAYITAKNGSKNAGLIKEYAGRSAKELKKVSAVSKNKLLNIKTRLQTLRNIALIGITFILIGRKHY